MDEVKALEELYDSFPDEEVFDETKPFDNFLIGAGSQKLMDKMNPKRGRFLDQLTGIHSLADLKKKPKRDTFEVLVDDLEEFAREYNAVKNPEEYFFNIKKRIFEKYEFLKEKSKEFAGRPVRERDLVLSNDDSYLLQYMEENGYNHTSIVNALAQLSAYKDIGLKDVVFYSVDDCPLCLAFEGSYYNIGELISIIGSEKLFIHKGAFCNFMPVFRSRSEDEFTVSAYVVDVHFKNLPIEFEEFITDDLLESIGKGFSVYFKDFSKLEDVSPGIVARLMNTTIEVHNGYIDRFSPLDFLKEFVKSEKKLIRSDEDLKISEDQEVFFLNGKKVVEMDGNYIDVTTGKVVELEEE